MSGFSLASGSNSLLSAPKAEATLLDAPKKQTLQPIVTGTTVIGLKYNGGVMLAADTLASYGSLARYKDIRRLDRVGENTIIGASGEMSDFQAIMKKLEHMNNDDIQQVSI
jgi:20S proteasome subunit beta 7